MSKILFRKIFKNFLNRLGFYDYIVITHSSTTKDNGVARTFILGKTGNKFIVDGDITVKK